MNEFDTDIRKYVVAEDDKKREDYIDWNEFFMGLAQLTAQRSKDPNSQVGACIVDEDNYVISVGYNGAPVGITDEEVPWGRDIDGKGWLNTKYPYVCHAELNAITNAHGKDLRGAKIYVTMFPCNECAKLIVQSGIQMVIYDEDKYPDSDITIASKEILVRAKGVRLIRYVRTEREITLHL